LGSSISGNSEVFSTSSDVHLPQDEESEATCENKPVCDFDQETYDALFEAGYSTEEINAIVAPGSSHMDVTLDSELDNSDLNESLDELHDSEDDNEDNANDIYER
jgi:hypothetical protein